MLMSDEVQICIGAMSLLQATNRIIRCVNFFPIFNSWLNLIFISGLVCSGLFGQLDEKITHQILDELIYKLSAASKADLAA
jgi:hypothetical protein